MKTDAKAPAVLRPRYAVARFPDYDGARFVAHGLTPAQVAGLKKAATELGILPQT